MSDSTLADFVGTFDVETAPWDGRTQGRILLNSSQVVFVADDEQERVPTSAIFDINVGTAPRNLDPVPETPMTIAYEKGGGRAVAVVGAPEDTIDKFESVLFRVLLNGRSVTLKHPARVGGRVTDQQYRPGTLSLSNGGVTVETSSAPVTIAYTAVTDFSRMSHDIDGQTRSTITIGHMNDGTAQTTHIATDTTRTSSLLGRYLRQRYDELLASLEDVTLSQQAVEALNTIYTIGGSPRQLVSVLGMSPDDVKRLIAQLGSDGLVTRCKGGFDLTRRGQVVVNQYMARVNE